MVRAGRTTLAEIGAAVRTAPGTADVALLLLLLEHPAATSQSAMTSALTPSSCRQPHSSASQGRAATNGCAVVDPLPG
jgi:hypothetical protein